MDNMQDTTDTVSKILDAAESRIRSQGFNAFSFRDIASDVGIKSASVHYHFPTKADLGEAVLSRYAQRLNAYLTENSEKNQAKDQLQRYIEHYENLLAKENAKCVAGMLASEQGSLPEDLAAAVKQYFDQQIDWLKDVFKRCYPDDKKKKSKARAQQLIAALQGGGLLALALGEKKILERAYKDLL